VAVVYSDLGSNSVTITDTTIRNVSYSALDLNNMKNVKLAGVKFENCTTFNNGGAVNAAQVSEFEIRNSTFAN
jgi:hypothetical protein